MSLWKKKKEEKMSIPTENQINLPMKIQDNPEATKCDYAFLFVQLMARLWYFDTKKCLFLILFL